jgi:transcription elongation factor Elf1
MPSPQEPVQAYPDGSPNNLRLCEHCDVLGVSSVVRSDTEFTDIIHCSICHLSFHFVTEGKKIIVTQITAYSGER